MWGRWVGLWRRDTVGCSPAISVEERLQRVTKADIEQVTARDIQELKKSVSLQELEVAMRLMLESNRIADVLHHTNATTWWEAASGISPMEMQIVGVVIRDRLNLLYNVLPYVSMDFLRAMQERFRSDTP